MGTAILTTILWMPALLGLGAGLQQWVLPTALHRKRESSLGELGFLGLIAAATISLLLNFLWPVGLIVSASVFLLGCFALHRYRARIGRALFRVDPGIAIGLVIIVPALSIMMNPEFYTYDSGHYHLGAIQWIQKSALPIGLANLYEKMGINSSWYFVQALFAFPSSSLKGTLSANFALAAFFFLALYDGIRHLSSAKQPYTYVLNFVLVLVTALIFARGAFIELGTSSGDIAATWVTLFVLLWLARIAEGDRSSDTIGSFIVFSLFAVTVKLSSLACSLVALGALGYLLRDKFPRSRRLLTVSLLIAGGWWLRGFLLTGCFLFPVGATCSNLVPWSMPGAVADYFARDVTLWARFGQGVSHKELRNWSWVEPWLFECWKDYFLVRVVIIAIALGLALWAISPWISVQKKARKVSDDSRRACGIALAFTGVGLAYWFWFGPAVRFGYGFLLGAGAAVLAWGIVQIQSRRNFALVKASPLFILICVIVLAKRVNVSMAPDPSVIMRWPVLGSSETELRQTEQGVLIRTPVSGDQCWLAPNPCTPYFNKKMLVREWLGKRLVFTRGGDRNDSGLTDLQKSRLP